MTASYRFRPWEHLRSPLGFRKVYDRKRSAADVWLIVYACENELPYLRLGMSVSRRFGPAVRRNRLRRIYREAFRLTRPGLPVGLDLVLIPRGQGLPGLSDIQHTLAILVPQLHRRLMA